MEIVDHMCIAERDEYIARCQCRLLQMAQLISFNGLGGGTGRLTVLWWSLHATLDEEQVVKHPQVLCKDEIVCIPSLKCSNSIGSEVTVNESHNLGRFFMLCNSQNFTG